MAGAGLPSGFGATIEVSEIESLADGVIIIGDNAGAPTTLAAYSSSAGTTHYFGGSTSSFPALIRSTTTLKVRLADDSADAALTCAGITASGNVDLDSDTALLRLGTNQDVILAWDAPNALAQRNGTTAQAFSLYNTYTSGTIFEQLQVIWSGNNCYIRTLKGSGGGSARTLRVGTEDAASFIVYTGGLDRWTFDSSGHMTAAEGLNIILGSTTGTKIGTATTQKIGVWGVTPVIQPAAYTQTYATATRTHADFTSADIGVFTGGAVGFLDAAERNGVRTQFNALRADVANLKQLVNQMIDDDQLIGWKA